MHLRRAAQRVGVLHAVAVVGRGATATIGGAGEQRAEVGGRDAPGPGAGGAPAGRRAKTPVGAEQRPRRSSRRRRRRSRSSVAQVGDGEDQHAEHAVGAVDEGEALLLGQLDRRRSRPRPGRRPRASASPSASRTSPSPISASAQCDSGARSPEQPSEPYSCTTGVMPALSRAAYVRAVSTAHAGAAGREGRQAQQHQGAHDLALDLGAGAGGVRADQRALQLGAQLGRDVPGRERAEAGRDAVVRHGVVRPRASTTRAAARDLGQRPRRSARRARRRGRPRRRRRGRAGRCRP